MINLKLDSSNLAVLPEYRDVTIELAPKRTQHWYRVSHFGEQPLPSVTTVLGVIAKPALIPWAKKVGRESVQTVLDGLPLGEPIMNTEDIIDQAKKLADPGTLAAEAGVRAHERIAAALNYIMGDESPKLKGLNVVQELINWYDGRRTIWGKPEVFYGLWDVLPALLGAIQFMLDYNLTTVAVEYPSWHPVHKSPGTIDLVARDSDGRLVVADWKRSSGIYNEHGYQIAAYAANIEALTGETVAAAYVVRLPKEPHVFDSDPAAAPQYEVKEVKNRAAAWLAFLTAQELFSAQREKVW